MVFTFPRFSLKKGYKYRQISIKVKGSYIMTFLMIGRGEAKLYQIKWGLGRGEAELYQIKWEIGRGEAELYQIKWGLGRGEAELYQIKESGSDALFVVFPVHFIPIIKVEHVAKTADTSLNDNFIFSITYLPSHIFFTLFSSLSGGAGISSTSSNSNHQDDVSNL
ncbi:hypothetical protein C5167_041084 [Papaver somniferum]|uniref:Uncharacterized protein n=1 Tax=Papaver somniferum TaxID=3469 RepID=A0A4Y7IL09_PAPSO|nr:hypothetical protein C5167_041084 [Papaver somniferum]